MQFGTGGADPAYADMAHVLDLVRDLAIYEHELDSVKATEESLMTTLGLNPAKPGPAYAKALLLFSEDNEGSSHPDQFRRPMVVFDG